MAIERRTFVKGAVCTLAGAAAAPKLGWAQAGEGTTRVIPSSGEEFPAP